MDANSGHKQDTTMEDKEVENLSIMENEGDNRISGVAKAITLHDLLTKSTAVADSASPEPVQNIKDGTNEALLEESDINKPSCSQMASTNSFFSTKFTLTFSQRAQELKRPHMTTHPAMDGNNNQNTGYNQSSAISCGLQQSMDTTLGENGKPMNLRDRSNRKPIQDRVRQKRQTLQDMTRPLKQWLYSHRDNPYPNKTEKVQLARSSQMTLTQVSNWFANARRRLKNTVRGPEMTWAKRIKLYNNYVEGNQELLSVGSSSSDDEMTEIPENVRIVTGEGSTISQEDMISDHSALDAQQVAPEVLPPPVHSPNLQDRLLGRDVPTPAVAHQFGSHTTITPPSFSALSQPTAPTDPRQMPTHPQNPAPQPTDFRDPSTTGNTKLLSGSDTWGPPVEDIEPHAPKYKHSIMQRYLNDSYTFQSAMQALGSPERDPKEKERHRNPSGSLSSHDYEEYMSSASSSRSTPTREHQDSHIDEYEEFSRHWPDIKTRAEDDLYWKEISAALALTSLARSKYQAHHPTA